MKVYKREGPSDFYLFVKHEEYKWAICSNLKAEKEYIRSGSAGQACPAHPRNRINKNRWVQCNDWLFNKAKEDDAKKDWEEGGVFVQCTVHEHCSTWLG